MRFLNPAATMLLALIPVILLLYLLKLRRDERPVSSTYLWKKIVRDMQANAPWQRLQRNLLLFLQLLFLTALIIAAARPSVPSGTISSKSAVFIFDTSASMSAADVLPNRIETAKKQALQLIDGLESNTLITIINAGERPQTLVSLSTNRHLIRQALGQLQPGSGGSDLGSALQIAAAIARRQTDTHTIVLSDGSPTLPEQISFPGSITFIPVGSSAENQAISVFSLSKNPKDSSLTGYATAENYGGAPASRRLAVFADGVMISAADLEIPAGEERSLVVSGIISTTETAEARLLPPDSGKDYLVLDDRAYAIARPSEPITVTVIGSGNLFLETAISLLPNIKLILVKPDEPVDPTSQLVVYDGVSPKLADLPPGNLLFIAPPESTAFFTVTGRIKNPIPAIVEPADPMVENIDFSGVNILDSAELSVPYWANSLVEDSLSPRPRPALIFIGEVEGRRIGVLSFSLTRSDLPLQIAFPILISNLVSWLTPGSSGGIPASISTGQPLKIELLPDEEDIAAKITVTKPDGNAVQLDGSSGQLVFADTGQTGIYQINIGNQKSITFAVNSFSPNESRIAVQTTLPIKQTAGDEKSATTQTGWQEYWRLAAATALFLLILEWLVFHRSVLNQQFRRLRIPSRKAKPSIR